MNKEIIHIMNDISSWLRYQKQLGVEFIPNGPELSVFLDHRGKDKMSLQGLTSTHDYEDKIPAPTDLDGLRRMVENCNRCELHKKRQKIVFGEGPENAKLVLVGEAPGREEDIQGRPFVGPSGELLTDMLNAVNIARKDVFITSVIKCRPPHNRTPGHEEIAACSFFLRHQLRLIDPPLILALGLVAAQTLLKEKGPLKSLRGRFHQLGNAGVMPIYHPAYLLRSQGSRQRELKRVAWQDLQILEKEYAKYC
ncbi:MAG: uracil-DNA glycosylase [Thermodesulfobacteriota bacterium]|nr:uracil-DNA glycosylase [Thermodesulfobacteriota bacterium]